MTHSNYAKLAASLLVLWFAASFLASAKGLLQNNPLAPPLGLLMAVLLPIILFFVWFNVSSGFREFALSLDLKALTVVQSWRFVGFGFLALYAYGILPASFALPAGLGDMAIGITAPLIALRFSDSRYRSLFLLWNALGITDLVTAVSMGAASRGAHPSTAPMAVLPLSLVPAFAVPLLTILHVIAIAQARRWPAGDAVQVAGRAPSLSA
jgi:hypothetical protein